MSDSFSNTLSPEGFADEVLSRGIVLLRPDSPFTWASGWKSPIYVDNRRILSYPSLRKSVAASLASLARRHFGAAGTVAAVATGAIAHGALVAHILDKPMVYVRPKPKDHGTQVSIEGVLEPGSKVVVIEDLISTGMSSLAAVKALKEAGAEVLGMVAIFTYAFQVAMEAFEKEGVVLHTVSSYPALVSRAIETGRISQSDAQLLSSWRENPSQWNGR